MALSLANCRIQHSRRTVLSIDQIALPSGAVSAIIGPNGAGKSTLLKQFLYHSEANWQQQTMAAAMKQHQVAWVGQHEHFQLPMTLSEYIMMGRQTKLAWYRRPKQTDKDLAAQLLAHFDLADLHNKRIETLSGGEKQRAAIIRALLQEAQLLMLDEPTNYLDVRYQHRLMDYLRILPQRGTTVVMVLHDLNLAAHYSDYILLMDEGRAAASGRTADVMDTGLLSRIYRWPIQAHHADGRIWFQAKSLSADA